MSTELAPTPAAVHVARPDGPFRVLVIGGSVGGLAAAHELRAVCGATVSVYERSPGPMQLRGAGVVVEAEVAALLGRLGVPAESVSVPVEQRQRLADDGSLTQHCSPKLVTSWDVLYRALRDSLDDVTYRMDSALTFVRTEAGQVTVGFADGHEAVGDLLVAADGGSSTVRTLLDPNATAAYAGYVAWRGLVPEADLPPDIVAGLQDRLTYYVVPGTQMLSYLVPGADGSRRLGERRVNWVWYRNVSEPDLGPLLRGRSGQRYRGFLPAGELSVEAGDALMAVADEVLPDLFARLVRGSAVFMQPVQDLRPARMIADRTVLVGDAAGTVRPHTASGTSKAFGDAAGLARTLQTWSSDRPLPLDALKEWETNRVSRLIAVGRLGRMMASGSSLGGNPGAAPSLGHHTMAPTA